MYADFLAFPVQPFEGDKAIDLGKEGEILTHPNVCSRMNARPVLSNQDGSCMNHLPPKAFHSQSLTGAVPAVPGTSLPLFVSHTNLLKTLKNA
jgi:hypothetical protein